MSDPLVLAFSDGDRSMADLLGGKGANLAEMTRLGLPVPHGFIITTEACRAYLRTGGNPSGLAEEVDAMVAALEESTGRRLGDPADPLLVSVRSGARFSMPGMMETVLNVGLTDASIDGLAARGGERFAWDCYRRLVQMYGRTVLGVDAGPFEERLAKARAAAGVTDDTRLGADSLRALAADFRALVLEESGEDLPQDPREQLDRAVQAVFSSWNGTRARLYRRHEGIPDDLGTAVNIVEMVYGNTGPRSGSGVCFTRDPATGSPGMYGDYLRNAQGEDVVAGTRVTVPVADLARLEPEVHAQLRAHLETLERHYRDLCDVEFTVEDGRLWVLQTRVGKRSPAAAFRIASDLVDEGVVTEDEALLRVDGPQLDALLHGEFADESGHAVLATGLPASPGAAVGEVVFDSATAVARAAEGAAVVLVREETSPDDFDGMLAAVAVVTARGGLTSHAAVVARGLDRTCVTGVESLDVDVAAREARGPDGVVLRAGDVVSVDGTRGRILAGAVAVHPSPLWSTLTGEAPEGGPAPGVGSSAGAHAAPVVEAATRLLRHADGVARLGVRANAETVTDARTARRLGAQGIGLCRTEHMLLGARRELVERVVLDDERDAAIAEIERVTREDLTGVLVEMDGLPVVVRLLDPPLHEFLPDLVSLSVEAALAESHGGPDPVLARRLDAVRHWHESNPMLGLRGVRLLSVIPDLLEAQVRAVVDATLHLRARGLDPLPEVMVPLVADRAELATARTRVLAAGESAAARHGRTLADVGLPVGVMIELPRAALTAGALAAEADFFSFGTNDLTQTTWGISRDDAETGFLDTYQRTGLLTTDPFVTLDVEGVGELVRTAVVRGRAAHPGLGLGVCGEHGGDPASIAFFDAAGLDYVSCSAPRVPGARLEAGRAAVRARAAGDPGAGAAPLAFDAAADTR